MANLSSLCLDHVILLLPYAMLSDPPSWLTDNFTISPGGQHADGKTENRLVLFRDGTYLELIAFINDDPEKRKGHWWDKPYGVVDYAFTTSNLDYDGITSRLSKSGTAISYEKPRAGGRVTPDGKELKWEVTFPTGVERGNIPFFCTDVTPRERRVAATEENITHLSGVLGMAGMLLEIEKDGLGPVAKVLAAVLDQTPPAQDGHLDVLAPNDVEKLNRASVVMQEAPSDSDKPLALTLRLQTAEHEDKKAIQEPIDDGVVSISFE
ncbi:uncharacterized protein LTR77_002481 [Saxophila tyrrhenica]|uniref:Glyoxalase-like domain-containing protein n=1 Tax=Saxophila tyrrhenica TaxID=1690608 RepID=A0AAV9PLS8_9PEZI|nr:hypothetical protein LTR77_002481 [Saxophila tyrrhenica]